MKKGWEIRNLGDVCKLTRGHNPPKSKFINEPRDGYIRFYQIRDGWAEDYAVYVPDSPQLHKVNPDEFLMVAYRHIGKVFRGVSGAFNVALCKISISKRNLLNDDFLFYMIPTEIIRGELLKRSERSLIPSMSVEHLKEIPIPIPTLPEQQSIVAILDEAFEAINQAKTNTEKNLQNAKELFQSELNIIFTKKGEGWVEKKLNEICEVKDGTHDSPRYIPDGIPFITQKNIRIEGLSFDNTRFITQVDHEKFYKRSNVAYGDILISMIGANRGMACIVDDERIFSIKNVGLVKANKDINPNYILYFLKSQRAVSYVKSFSKGGAQEFIGLTELRSFPVPIAPTNDQQRIVNQLDTLSLETKQLEENYRKKLESLEELKKSILQKAFSGELTTVKEIAL